MKMTLYRTKNFEIVHRKKQNFLHPKNQIIQPIKFEKIFWKLSFKIRQLDRLFPDQSESQSKSRLESENITGLKRERKIDNKNHRGIK